MSSPKKKRKGAKKQEEIFVDDDDESDNQQETNGLSFTLQNANGNGVGQSNGEEIFLDD
jgi:hypothetical protein